MNTKMFLSLLAAGSFCVVAPAQAQQPYAGTTGGAQGTTKQTSGNANKQADATSNKAADKTGKAGAKASGPQQKMEMIMGMSGLTPPKSTVSAGTVVLSVRNSSDKPHKVVLEGGTLKKISVNLNMNSVGTIDGVLEPGTYTVSCQTSGHHESSAKLTVK